MNRATVARWATAALWVTASLVPIAASPAPSVAPPAANAAPTDPGAPPATAPAGSKEFDVKLSGFRIGFDVSVNGRLIGRMIDSTSEATITSAVRPGLNHIHVRWFSEGQPSAGSLSIRAKDASGNWQSFLSIRKNPFSDSEAERDADFTI